MLHVSSKTKSLNPSVLISNVTDFELIDNFWFESESKSKNAELKNVKIESL